MLHVNDDTNDELFRRAAENYPLKTDSPDWEAVLNKVNSANSAAEPAFISKKRKRNYRFLLLLLLLIPLAIFENRRTSVKETTVTSQTNTSEKTAGNPDGSIKPNTSVPINDNTAIPSTHVNEPLQPAATNAAEPGNTQAVIANQKNNTPVLIAGITDNNTNPSTGKRNYASKQKSKFSIKNAQAVAEDDDFVSSSLTKGRTTKKKKTRPAANIAITNPTEENAAITKDETEPANDPVVTGKQTEPEATMVDKAITLTKEDSVKTEPKTKEAEKELAKTTDKTGKKENKKERQKRFYIGLIGGMDFSTVKLQSVKKTGLNYGLVVGYKLSKRFSIETGLIKDKKYYSTDGKYFTPKDLNYPGYEKLEYVTGDCNMLELPINVRYTFASKKRSAWFGSLGVSSYFMQHESYIYDINYNGYIYSKAYDYSNKSTAFLAVVNISAGYTYKLGKIGDLRFEPYIKLPINKVGTGKLPIQSGGFNLGFTKTIF